MRAEVTKGALQGTSITYNDYFNESSDEGSYVESSEEGAARAHTHTHTHTHTHVSSEEGLRHGTRPRMHV